MYGQVCTKDMLSLSKTDGQTSFTLTATFKQVFKTDRHSLLETGGTTLGITVYHRPIDRQLCVQ